MKIKVNSGYIVEDPADSRRCMLIAYNAASDHVYVFRRGEIVFLDLDDPENQPEAAEEEAAEAKGGELMRYVIKSNGIEIAKFRHECDRDLCLEALKEAYDDANFEAVEAKEGE